MKSKEGSDRVCLIDEKGGIVFKIPKSILKHGERLQKETAPLNDIIKKYTIPKDTNDIDPYKLVKTAKENVFLSQILIRAEKFKDPKEKAEFLRKVYLKFMDEYIDVIWAIQENIACLICPSDFDHVVNRVTESVGGIINISPLGKNINVSQEEYKEIREEVFGIEKIENNQLGHTFDSVENFKLFQKKLKICDLGSFNNDVTGYKIDVSDIEQLLFLLEERHKKNNQQGLSEKASA